MHMVQENLKLYKKSSFVKISIGLPTELKNKGGKILDKESLTSITQVLLLL